MKRITLTMIMAITAIFGFAQAQWQYINPIPGSKYINPEQAIALRHGEVLDNASVRADLFTLATDKNDELKGTVKLSLDGRTLIFKPEKPFNLNEMVYVNIASGIKTNSGLELPELSFSFQTKPVDNTEMLNEFYLLEEEKELQDYEKNSDAGKRNLKTEFKNDNNLPERFPPAHVTEFDNPIAGNIFCTPRPMGAAPYDPYSAILDNYGTPVYYREWPRRNNDFKLLVNNQLTFCDFDNGNSVINKYLLMDSHFNIIDTLMMGNGYHVDQHDILMRENGNHFLMAYDPQVVGMDTVVEGGNPEATVIGFIVQELDADHNVVFQWRSWDHYEITDANHTDFLDDRIDYVHGNAFEIDFDGNLLMSLRNMEEITKIDMNTGEIIWRFGLHAKNNMFEFLNDTVGFSWQHDVRRLPNGNITVYDNGVYHVPESFSQAVEYQLNVDNWTAELVWDYQHDPVVYGRATGAHRRLENNNAFICWGLTWPMNYSEVTHEKNLAWDFGWTQNVWDYRAFKFDWKTDLFELSQDTVDFGVYDDYVTWPRIITITNNGSETIEITSTHNFLDCYEVVTPLPLEIQPGETKNFQFNLFPTTEEGQLDDVLTLNYDSFYSDSLYQRISQQLFITAYVEDLNAPTATITPVDGSVDVDRSSQVEIAFNERLVYPDGSVIKSADLSNLLTFKETDANGTDVEFMAYLDAWKQNITIIPMEMLAPGMQYYVELPGGTVADHEGHVLENAVMTTFNTIDDVAPVVEVNPADSTTGAYVNQMIIFSFDEAVQNADSTEITEDDIQNIFSLKHNDEEGEEVEFLGVIDDTKTTITLHPVENLDSYQYYYVEMMADMVSDMAGNVVSEMKYSHFETGEEVGIDEMNQVNISITPNPTKGNVDINIDQSGSKLIEVYNLTGSKIFEFVTNQNQTSLNLDRQKAGIYILKVTFDDHSTTTRKLVKK